MIIENDVAKLAETHYSNFCYLLEFNYKQLESYVTMSDWSPQIHIKLLDTNKYDVLELSASNASGLKIPNNLSSASAIMLDVEDIKSRQLSGLNYHIRDMEEDCFSFMCRDFKIEIKKWEGA